MGTGNVNKKEREWRIRSGNGEWGVGTGYRNGKLERRTGNGNQKLKPGMGTGNSNGEWERKIGT